MQRYRSRALAWTTDWLAPLAGRRGAGAPPVEAERMTHAVPYQKRLATAEGLLAEKGVLRHYQPIADWLEPLLATTSDLIKASKQISEKDPVKNKQRRGYEMPVAPSLKQFVMSSNCKVASIRAMKIWCRKACVCCRA